MQKIFRAISQILVEADFILKEPIPDGWYATRAEALDNFKGDQNGVQEEQETTEEVKRGRGRPRKV